MKIGAAMFFTDYSMSPAELALALEERGFDSLWAPEHSHIPLVRQVSHPSGGELPKQYYDVMDPFVTLTAAAMASRTLLIGTGICLVVQRDPIQTAKSVASLDQISGGRFLFGVGNGWNQEEIDDHGTVFATRHKLARERIEAMQAIWTQSKPEYHGEIRRLRADDDLAEAGAEAAPADHRRRRVSLGRQARGALRQRLDAAPRAQALCGCRGAGPAIPRHGDRGRAAARKTSRSPSGACMRIVTRCWPTATWACSGWC